jgi:hypothetical protein
MTAGERRLSERLEQKLEDDYLCWYNVPVGPKQLHPDFIIVHPQRGFLVLEVKDWKLDTLVPGQTDRHSFQIYTDRGIVTEKNPQLQARVYALEVAMALERDPALRNPSGHRYAGKLVMPYGWGAVLTNITRAQLQASGLEEALEPGRVICRDEMLDSVTPEAFQARLWGMFAHPFPCKLTLPQLDRIRWHLFPEVRINTGVNQFGLFDGLEQGTQQIQIPDLVKVMDLNQELLARSMGDGHRVIHGVAGSGKTMILGYRCLHLAKTLAKPILVLCFNVTLGARLREVIESQGLTAQVVVRHFHDWCKEMLGAFHVDKPKWNPDINAYSAELVARTITGVDQGLIPRGQYGAVMIDEGHDFEPEWFKLVVQMVDPESNSVLVLYDDAQAIYTKRERRKFSFASVGIKAQGRTTILKLNYRNTLEVLAVARAFSEDLLSERNEDDEGIPLVSPESAGRRGPMPVLLQASSPKSEAILIAEQILDARDQGRSLSEMAVIYRRDHQIASIQEQLKQRGIEFRVANDQASKRTLFAGGAAVKLVSMHSSKGLEFHTVFIPNLGGLPLPKEPEEEEARLLYVAMTRATDRLVMSCYTQSRFSQRVTDSVRTVAEKLAA